MFLFPFGQIPRDSKIILYGAGVCGKTFFKQITASRYCQILLWADKKASEIQSQVDKYGCAYPVRPVEEISTVDNYDFIVIALQNKEISEQVYRMLIDRFAANPNKIVTLVHEIKNDTVYNNYKNEYLNLFNDEDFLQNKFPEEIIKSNELSIMPRYLLCRDMVNNVFNEANVSLYMRTILAQGDLFTKDNYFSNRDKRTTEDFLTGLRDLVKSVQENDFDKRNYIPIVYGNRIILDGQHRIATALALEKKLWVRYYPDDEGYGEGFPFSWFEENGFNTDDKLRILRAFADVHADCGIVVIFGTVREHWEYILQQLKKSMNIVGHVDLDFSSNYLGFENVLREFYSDPLWQNVQIHLKCRLLMLSPLVMRVVLVSDELEPNADIYKTIRSVKLNLRDSLFFESEPNAGVVMHASDSFDEFVLLKNILLSPNNINTVSKCTFRKWRQAFIDRLIRLKNLLYEHKIRLEDAIVVGGSVLEIFGLRESDDLDITVKKKYRSKLGVSMKKLSDDIDLCARDSIVDENGKKYSDDLLIDDDNFHFVFFGIKFMNMEILYSKKKRDARDKDIRDVKLMRMFFEYAANFDNKYVLRRQIDKELYLRRFE